MELRKPFRIFLSLFLLASSQAMQNVLNNLLELGLTNFHQEHLLPKSKFSISEIRYYTNSNKI